MTSRGQCPRGVLVNAQEWGYLSFFGGRMTSRGQCPRGGACECLDPPPLSGNPVSAPGRIYGGSVKFFGGLSSMKIPTDLSFRGP